MHLHGLIPSNCENGEVASNINVAICTLQPAGKAIAKTCGFYQYRCAAFVPSVRSSLHTRAHGRWIAINFSNVASVRRILWPYALLYECFYTFQTVNADYMPSLYIFHFLSIIGWIPCPLGIGHEWLSLMSQQQPQNALIHIQNWRDIRA